ncbi:HAD family hydrolase [Eubacteriales bacterium OttesenSCG-928-K08]|nr:HAD family hydrolase [Eubacteriales bacterium OttesenSCG-928-K08]
MIKAVVFDMGGVIHSLTLDKEKRLSFAADTIKLLESRGLHIPDSPEVFDAKLKEAGAARKRRNEQTLHEEPALISWTHHYLKEYGATEEQIFPIVEKLSYSWLKNRFVDTPREGLHECLEGLYSQGMRLGIISNTVSRTFAPDSLCRYGVSHYFEYILLSSVCGLRKPGAEIFTLCRDSMGLTNEECAYVGDTISRDVIGVHNAGWQLMIRILEPGASLEVQERERKLAHLDYHPDYTVNELHEIPAIIAAYNQSLLA